MSIAHGFMSILIHRAQFMSIARYELCSYFGTMYELCSYYDKWLYHRRAMLYHIIYDLYHDPYWPLHPSHGRPLARATSGHLHQKACCCWVEELVALARMASAN